MAKQIYNIEDLLYLMSRLRNPQTGCPWDLEQDFFSLVPYVLEEAYEVADTIERRDFDHFAEELGDLLFQVVFHSQLANEQYLFNFHEVVNKITAKLIRRHPHVFPEGTLDSERSPDTAISNREISTVWESKKQDERHSKGHQSLLSDVPVALPSLSRAQKIQKRAAKAGFDWADIGGVIDKVREEISELEDEIAHGDRDRQEDELGDLFFALVNLARHLHIDAETSVRRATGKFEGRFSHMERNIKERGDSFDQLTASELDRLWEIAKQKPEKLK